MRPAYLGRSWVIGKLCRVEPQLEDTLSDQEIPPCLFIPVTEFRLRGLMHGISDWKACAWKPSAPQAALAWYSLAFPHHLNSFWERQQLSTPYCILRLSWWEFLQYTRIRQSTTVVPCGCFSKGLPSGHSSTVQHTALLLVGIPRPWGPAAAGLSWTVAFLPTRGLSLWLSPNPGFWLHRWPNALGEFPQTLPSFPSSPVRTPPLCKRKKTLKLGVSL